MDNQYKYILRLEGEYQEPDNKRDIAEYDSPDEAVEAGLFYINEANEFLGDVKSDWMLLESDLKEGKFVAKRDMPDPQPCIYLKSIKVKKKDNTSLGKEASSLKGLVETANELDRRGLAKEADILDSIILSKLGSSTAIPLDEWDGPPEGFNLFTHSTGTLTPSDFGELTDTGMRIATSGGGSLLITFMPEDSRKIKESLRQRVASDNNSYNFGSTVIMAAIDPELLRDRGIADDVSSEDIFLSPTPIKNVRVLENWDSEHKWSDNAWKLPGRFLLAAYDGINDVIHINDGWSGSRSTELGERMVNNLSEYTARNKDLGEAKDISFPSELPDDPDIW